MAKIFSVIIFYSISKEGSTISFLPPATHEPGHFIFLQLSNIKCPRHAGSVAHAEKNAF